MKSKMFYYVNQFYVCSIGYIILSCLIWISLTVYCNPINIREPFISRVPYIREIK